MTDHPQSHKVTRSNEPVNDPPILPCRAPDPLDTRLRLNDSSRKSRLFSDTTVWQKAHSWVLGVYRTSRDFPSEEMFGLTAQLRRAAVSVPGNFAEGFKRRTLPDKLKFFTVAQASLEECRYYLILARDLHYADTTGLTASLDEVAKLLAAYTKAVSLQLERNKR